MYSIEDDYEDEYEYLYDEEFNKKRHRPAKNLDGSEGIKSKKKKKDYKLGSKQELWDRYSEENTEDFEKEIVKEVKKEEKRKVYINNKKVSHVRNFRGVSINLDNVLSITKIENTYNNVKTFGIKFVFKQKEEDKFYRIIWFNQNEKACDEVLSRERKIWEDINNCSNNPKEFV